MIIETQVTDFAALIEMRAPHGLVLADTPIAPVAVLQMLALLDAQIRQSFAPSSWLIVDGLEIVGLCSITSVSAQGSIDIGYGIAPSRQGRGLASAAIAALVDWARSAPAVTAITADTGVDNVASRQVLVRNGFVRIGERIDDEDGALICWRHDLLAP